jgi:prepilin-type processing-associated H-X9-DG protein
LWWNCVDPYLNAKQNSYQTTYSGVAQYRTYKSYKECPVWESFDGPTDASSQDPIKGAARTYKMNQDLCHPNYTEARITEVKFSSQWVMMGDGVSIDQVGPIANQIDSSAFAMDTLGPSGTKTYPVLRHANNKGANLLFVDGHVETTGVKAFQRNSGTPPTPAVVIQTLPPEWLGVSGNPPGSLNPKLSAQANNVHRNPAEPYYWSDPGRLFWSLPTTSGN